MSMPNDLNVSVCHSRLVSGNPQSSDYNTYKVVPQRGCN